MSDTLTKEIVRRVLADIGIVSLKNRDTWDGLCNPELKSQKTVKIQYDGQTIDHDVYTGKLVFNDFYINGLLVDLGVTTDKDVVDEFVFVFQAKDKPLQVACYSSEGSVVKIYNEKSKIWHDASVQLQSMMLTGFEQLCSLGILWAPNNDVDVLYKAAVEIISSIDQ